MKNLFSIIGVVVKKGYEFSHEYNEMKQELDTRPDAVQRRRCQMFYNWQVIFMPWPPHPFTFTCPQCHWCRTTVPPSDALREGVDWFSNCPSCRHTALDVRPATRLEILKARLERPFRPRQ